MVEKELTLTLGANFHVPVFNNIIGIFAQQPLKKTLG